MTLPFNVTKAIEVEKPSAIFGLFSGGHDSLCSTHMASHHPRFAGVVHCNTGIGIEQTRDYVRQVCADQGWFLYELHPPTRSYRDLVLGEHLGGFPGGPKSHQRHYFYLKQQALDAHVQRAKTHRKDRIGLVTGIRRAESTRRMAGAFAEPAQRDGAQLWLNPILDWTEKDKNAYMEGHRLPRNEVVDVLHRSGECLCGAFTSKGEFRMIEIFYPEAADQIKALEGAAQAKFNPINAVVTPPGCFWGRRDERENPDQLDFLPLCVGCMQEEAA